MLSLLLNADKQPHYSVALTLYSKENRKGKGKEKKRKREKEKKGRKLNQKGEADG